MVLGALITYWHSIGVEFPRCVPPPNNLVAWWRAEGDSTDATVFHHGTQRGGVKFGGGKVGAAFLFNGVTSFLEIPDDPVWNFGSSEFSIEFWVNFRAIEPGSAPGQPAAIFVAHDEGRGDVNKWFFSLGGGKLNFVFNARGETTKFLVQAPFTPTLGQWYHLVLVRAGSILSIYKDGVLIGTESVTFSVPDANAPLTIGQGEGIGYLNGLMDELAIYKRELIPSEIRELYLAGAAGKCGETIAPFLLSQSEDWVTASGTDVEFRAEIGGSPPFQTRWLVNDTAILGATNLTLLLEDVHSDDSGVYSVLVTSAGGTIGGDIANLTVIEPGQCVPPPDSIVAWWRAEGRLTVDSAGTNDLIGRGGASWGSGFSGGGFILNGSTAYLEAPDSELWTFGEDDFSIELWAKFRTTKPASSVSQPSSVFIGSDEGPKNLNKWFFGFGGGKLFLSVNTPNTASKSLVQAPFAPHMDQWYHLALVRHENLFTVYTNGLPAGTEFESGPLPNVNATLTIGQVEANFFFDGALDDVAVYRRALSATDIQTLFAVGSTGKCGPPVAPIFFDQSQSAAIAAGAYLDLHAFASGSAPLRYQWQLNGTEIPGATNDFLNLLNVETVDAGAYSALASNEFGTAVSSEIEVSVIESPPCLSPPPGLIAWWTGDPNARDSRGENHGTLKGGTLIQTGKVRGAFSFSGSATGVEVPDNDLWAFGENDFSIEFWVNFHSLNPDSDEGHPAAVFLSSDEGPGKLNKWFFSLGGGNLSFAIADRSGALRFLAPSPFEPDFERWYHLAIVRDGNRFKMYRDGRVTGFEDAAVNVPNAAAPLAFGQAEGIFFLDGLLDEISIYRRALPDNEIKAVYDADSAGKCLTPAPPLILSQPQSRSAELGTDVLFRAEVAGTPPLIYQWLFNGATISGATNLTLGVSNVRIDQAGVYALQVTNLLGSTLSSNATLSVTLPASLVEAGRVETVTGSPVSFPVALVSNGMENSVSFSLTFSTQHLTYVRMELGKDAGEASLLLNDSQAQNGKISAVVVLPANAEFPLGPQELARVRFASQFMLTNNPITVPIAFADQPIESRVFDAEGQTLPSSFVDGAIAFAPSDLEADVTPHPSGNMAVTAADWNQLGLYAARLENPATASEFQRADCAPRSTLGDGFIKVTDWVQAGRYALALDPLAPSGGPEIEISDPAQSALDGGENRRLRLEASGSGNGRTIELKLILEALGNENALGFTVNIEPDTFRYESVVESAATAGAVLNVNTNMSAVGVVGVALALPPGQVFSEGAIEILTINLESRKPVFGQTSVGFGDQIIPRAVSDSNAAELPADYTDAGILGTRPMLLIERSATTVDLVWPISFEGAVLQTAVGSFSEPLNWTNAIETPQIRNSDYVVRARISDEARFFRLIFP